MIVFWSVMTGAVGFTSEFWQVALVRVGQSIGEAGCTPFAAGLIAAYFPAHIKGTAMSVYQIGMYVGAWPPVLCCDRETRALTELL